MKNENHHHYLQQMITLLWRALKTTIFLFTPTITIKNKFPPGTATDRTTSTPAAI
jgi:hypothetical protein